MLKLTVSCNRARRENLELALTALDADEAIALAEAERPEVAILDLTVPAGGAPRAIRGIRERSPETAIVILRGRTTR
jgi:DNA-binding NarL/FixJ family response regulator